LDNKLDADTKHKVEQHLAKCNTCSDEVEETMQLMDAMQNRTNKQPSASLKTGFYKMLDNEKNKSSDIVKINPQITRNEEYGQRGQEQTHNKFFFYRVAATIAILITGFLIGYMFNPNRAGNGELASLQNDVTQMKTMMFSQLDANSASKRIEAVRDLEKYSKPDEEVTQSLINTMNNDENINVRTAAANALSKYAYDEDVKSALINALDKQKDPLMQITLINILVDLKERKAIEPMKELLLNDSTMNVVRAQAKLGVDILAR
jgi:predicted nucleic-acid-binding protein